MKPDSDRKSSKEFIHHGSTITLGPRISVLPLEKNNNSPPNVKERSLKTRLAEALRKKIIDYRKQVQEQVSKKSSDKFTVS